MTGQMAAMARGEKLDLLAYFLDMARIEAATADRPTAETLADALAHTHASPAEELAGLAVADEVLDGAPATDLSLFQAPVVEEAAAHIAAVDAAPQLTSVSLAPSAAASVEG